MSKKDQRYIHCFWIRENGVASVEFAMVFIPFIISILFIAELCRVAYISSTLDLLLAESGHVASVSSSASNYQQYFLREMNEKIRQKPLFSRGANIHLSIMYCADIEALTSTDFSRCISEPPDNMPLAVYKISVDYRPLFFIFPRASIAHELSRRIVLIQEFQNKLEVKEY